jgi:molybdopterin-guanine dinucleotide biosynthesis protein A
LRPVGFAVAGGQSRRMGRDKALLPWGDTDLLGHTLARLAAAGASEVRILSGARPRYSERGVAVDIDPAPERGPMGGLLAALEAARGRPALLLGVDLPLVSSDLLRHLLALDPGADAVVPFCPRGPEPLCAVYGAGCLEAVRRHLAAGDLQMTSLRGDVRVREVGPDQLAAFGDPDRLFLNVNAFADYERALALAFPGPRPGLRAP